MVGIVHKGHTAREGSHQNYKVHTKIVLYFYATPILHLPYTYPTSNIDNGTMRITHNEVV